MKDKIFYTAAAPTPLFGTSNTNQTAGTGFGINTGQSTGFGSAFGSTQPNQVMRYPSGKRIIYTGCLENKYIGYLEKVFVQLAELLAHKWNLYNKK